VPLQRGQDRAAQRVGIVGSQQLLLQDAMRFRLRHREQLLDCRLARFESLGTRPRQHRAQTVELVGLLHFPRRCVGLRSVLRSCCGAKRCTDTEAAAQSREPRHAMSPRAVLDRRSTVHHLSRPSQQANLERPRSERPLTTAHPNPEGTGECIGIPQGRSRAELAALQRQSIEPGRSAGRVGERRIGAQRRFVPDRCARRNGPRRFGEPAASRAAQRLTRE
jgi:hypothetical protein